MTRRRRIRWRQLRIGLVATVVILTVGAAVFFIDQVREALEDRYSLHFFTLTSQAVRIRSPVWFAGQPVGHVRRLEFEPPSRRPDERLRVVLSIRRSAQPYIVEGSAAQIITAGRIGQTVVNIVPPETRADPLPDGGQLQRARRLEVLQLGRRVQSTLDSLGPVMEAWKRVLDHAYDGTGTLPYLIRQPGRIQEFHDRLAELERFFGDVRSVADRTVDVFHSSQPAFTRIGGQIDSLQAIWDRGGGSVGAMMRDTTIADRLERIEARIARLGDRIATGRGTVGRILHDRALATEWLETVTALRALRSELRNPSEAPLLELR